MKKTMNINIAGQLFSIDEDAFEILTRYLGHVSDRVKSEEGGEETISDIETRIAEIFGGGSEPPVLVSREMVDNMINIMGAPEDYTAESIGSGAAGTRKPMYDPDSLSARAGKAFSAGFKVFRSVISAVLRVLAVLLGTMFTIVGFILLFTFVILFFFNNAAFVKTLIEPDMQNIQMLLSIVLGNNVVQTVLMLSAIAILIPLASLTYLGIKLIFKIGASAKLFKIIVFVTWIAALCALGVILSLRLSAYANEDSVVEKVKLDSPPRTLWIAPLKKISETGYDEMAAVNHFTFWKKSSTGQFFCTAKLNIYASDSTSGWISVEKRAHSNSNAGAWTNARKIGFSWKLSGDTLYFDEYFNLPEGSRWNGSTVEIDLGLPEGTVVKPVPGTSLATWLFRQHDPDAAFFCSP